MDSRRIRLQICSEILNRRDNLANLGADGVVMFKINHGEMAVEDVDPTGSG